MKTDEKARIRQRRYYERHKAAELARQKKYRQQQVVEHDHPVPVPVPGWGYWEVPF